MTCVLILAPVLRAAGTDHWCQRQLKCRRHQLVPDLKLVAHDQVQDLAYSTASRQRASVKPLQKIYVSYLILLSLWQVPFGYRQVILPSVAEITAIYGQK